MRAGAGALLLGLAVLAAACTSSRLTPAPSSETTASATASPGASATIILCTDLLPGGSSVPYDAGRPAPINANGSTIACRDAIALATTALPPAHSALLAVTVLDWPCGSFPPPSGADQAYSCAMITTVSRMVIFAFGSEPGSSALVGAMTAVLVSRDPQTGRVGAGNPLPLGVDPRYLPVALGGLRSAAP